MKMNIPTGMIVLEQVFG
jgi:regulator of protease activity HflC (stomatin/prohibitin superfamily)